MPSSALTHLHTLSFPLPSHKQRAITDTSFPRLLRRPIKAMASEGGRDSLDHLQRASSKMRQQQQQQQQASSQPQKRRVAQSPPFGLWDRFPTARTVEQMMDTMERVMEDPFAYSGASLSGEESMGGSYRRGRTPWEIKVGEGEYKMRFDMPGMTNKDVKVWVEEKMLVVKAEKLPKGGEEEEDLEEWSPKSYGRYNTRIALPDNVEVEKIKAEVKDGVLYITVPKASSLGKVLDIAVQ